MPANLAVALISLWISSASHSSQSLAVAKPPIPYVDIGACPFEGCVYREWVANSAVMIRKERSKTALLAFTVKKGERVTALTGVVITTKPGRVLFRESINLDSDSGVLHIEPGETLFLLTYQGEGSTKAWFQGKIYDHVLGETAFFDSRCEKDPSRCVGRIVERPVSEWWVQIRNSRGQIGWTKETDKFDGKDALGIEGGQTNCTTTPLHARNPDSFLNYGTQSLNSKPHRVPTGKLAPADRCRNNPPVSRRKGRLGCYAIYRLFVG